MAETKTERFLREASTALDALDTELGDIPPVPPGDLDTEADSTELAKLDELEELGYLQPWEQRPTETSRQFEAFTVYRDMGKTRSFRKTVDALGLNSETWIARVAKQNEWTERVTAFDRHEDRIYLLQRAEMLREMAERQTQTIADSLEAVMKPILLLNELAATDPSFTEELKQLPAKTLLDLSAKSARIIPQLFSAERAAQGLPTETIEITGEVTHNHELNRDQLAELFGALEQAGALDEFLGSGRAVPVLEGEIVEVRPAGEPGDSPEADSAPPPP